MLVGFLSPTPTTCRCPSACWAARKFVDAKGPDAWTMQLSRASSGQAHKERMAEPPRTRKKTARCACGSVELEAIGTPITSVACYCESCQEGSRQIEALPNRRAVCAIDGGTAYVLYRKDRVEYPKGSRLLRGFKLRDESSTRRVVAACCDSPMFLEFEKGHWLTIYRVAFPVPPLALVPRPAPRQVLPLAPLRAPPPRWRNSRTAVAARGWRCPPP